MIVVVSAQKHHCWRWVPLISAFSHESYPQVFLSCGHRTPVHPWASSPAALLWTKVEIVESGTGSYGATSTSQASNLASALLRFGGHRMLCWFQVYSRVSGHVRSVCSAVLATHVAAARHPTHCQHRSRHPRAGSKLASSSFKTMDVETWPIRFWI